MKKQTKWTLGLLTSALVATSFVACGGGGGGSIVVGGGGGGVISYPYETVFGDTCATYEATPGCTFSAATGQRITVSADPNYDRYGYGSDDLSYVVFYADGTGDVYSATGSFIGRRSVSSFAGWVGGNVIGVGTTGLFWENVTGGTYWLGKNGVLYNANLGESNYGEAINNKNAGQASDASVAALASDSNKRLVAKAADKLVKEYSLTKPKAMAIASALNTWAVSSSGRGYTTTRDIDTTFKKVFGVPYSTALSAVQDLVVKNDPSGMQDVTDRSATALGLKPHQAQKFIKGMYKKALASYGVDSNMVNW